MINYFDQSELIKVKKQRRVVLAVFFIVAALYIAASVVMWVMFFNLPYNSDKAITIKLIEYPLTAIFVIFCFLYLGIPFKRVNRYFKFVRNLINGIKEKSVAEFKYFSEEKQVKDGVDCKSLIFSEWNKYKKEFYERKVLVFYEKEFPKIEEGKEVEFITQGNFLIEYKYTEKGEENESDNNGNR